MQTYSLAKSRILVTGGRGFLGGHLVEKLRAHGCEQITAPSRSEYDLTNHADTERLFRDLKPEVIFHLAAAVGGIGLNEREPARLLHDNSLMGLHLLDAARRYRAQKVIAVGTTCSYPKGAPLPFKEEDLWNGYPEPVTGPYGIAKRLVQVQGQLYREQYGLNSVFVIPTNLYGPRDNFDERTSHVIPAIIKKVVDACEIGQDEVVLWGDGTATREFLYVADAAEMILSAAIHCNTSEPINLGTGIETPIRQVAELICKIVNYGGRIAWDSSRPNGQPRRVLDLSRARGHGLLHRHISLTEGMRRTVSWYQEKVNSLPARPSQVIEC